MQINKIRYANIFLIICSILLPISLTDFFLKKLKLPKDSSRIMLLAGSTLSTNHKSFRNYEPNKKIEQLAIYGNEIAYRYSYETNNLGLVSSPDIKKSDKLDLVINGDSFTEGQGGYPWIIELQNNYLKNLNTLSLNYAIAGNGFEDFLKASIHAKKFYKAKKNIIFFIEHDAYRPYQKIHYNEHCSYINTKEFRLLRNDVCKTSSIVWHYVDFNLDNDQILKYSKNLNNYGFIPSLKNFIKSILDSIKFKFDSNKEEYKFAKSELRFGRLPEYTFKAIKKINKIFGRENVLLVQLPDLPGEPNKKNLQFTKLLNTIDGNKIINLWESCPLLKSDFNNLDSHPNISGYKKIKKCISDNDEINFFLKKGD